MLRNFSIFGILKLKVQIPKNIGYDFEHCHCVSLMFATNIQCSTWDRVLTGMHGNVPCGPFGEVAEKIRVGGLTHYRTGNSRLKYPFTGLTG